MDEDALNTFRAACRRGEAQLDVTHTTFNLRDYQSWLDSEQDSIAAFKAQQSKSFLDERERWAQDNSAAMNPDASVAPVSLVSTDNDDTADVSYIAAPIAGKVVMLLVKPGDAVVTGQAVAVLEAMKMEVQVESQCVGVVDRCILDGGALCLAGQSLIAIKTAPAPTSLVINVVAATDAEDTIALTTPTVAARSARADPSSSATSRTPWRSPNPVRTPKSFSSPAAVFDSDAPRSPYDATPRVVRDNQWFQ
jgi:biotin carboxyl carrier protein